MKLTDKAAKAAKPKEKIYRLFDGGGLYLEISPKGNKYWRLKCRFNGKEDRLAFGVYPQVTLAEARQKREDARRMLAAGKNPRYAMGKAPSVAFKKVAEEWLAKNSPKWTERYINTATNRLTRDVYPRLGSMDMAAITAQDVLGVIRAIDSRGAAEKARKVLGMISRIFAYAIVTQPEITQNPAIGLSIAISQKPVQHNPYLSEKELPEFLQRVREYTGHPVVVMALRFMLITMVRTQEMRFAVWPEIDEKKGVWTIPAERMKMRRPHIVPLPRQAVAILQEAKKFRQEDIIFPSPLRRGRVLSENAVLYALYDMGYRGRLTGHGFRATASTILNERGFSGDAIEMQLAHVDKNRVRAAYNHAEILNERRVLLQAWADLLDQLENADLSTH